MAFRIQDLMMDVRPGARAACDGYQMANPECTCQITVRPEREIGTPPDDELEDGPDDPEQGSDDSSDGPPEKSAHAAGLALLRAQLQHNLGLGA